MSETDNNSQGQKPKTSKLGVAAVILAIPGLCILYGELDRVERASSTYLLTRDLAWLSAVIGLILGIVALLKIKKSRGALTGWKWAIAGIGINALFSVGWFLGPNRWELMRYPTMCRRNLSQLSKALVIYGNDNDQFPPAEKWCDALLNADYVSEENFVCARHVFFLPFLREPVMVWPLPKRGRSHYALNPNARIDSPPDMVLLFETGEGWNKCGGLETLSVENHEGSGCNVSFIDTHVEFTGTEMFARLKWTLEESK